MVFEIKPLLNMLDNEYTFDIQFIYHKNFRWDPEKENWLQMIRNLSFESLVTMLKSTPQIVLDISPHSNFTRYPGQQIMIININQYAHLVPYVETKNEIFLKTIIPSRKATKIYLT